MSQMGKVIREVNKLFNCRGEQVLAMRRDMQLFEEAKKFKAAIDDFEVRAKREMEVKNVRKRDPREVGNPGQ